MKVTVGKIKKRKVIKYCIGLLAPLFFYLFLLMNIDLGYDNYKECLLFIFITTLFIVMLFVLPSLIFLNSMWEVDQNSLKYIHFDHNLDKTKYLYSFLFRNKYPRYQINLRLSQIDFVQISYYHYSFYPSKYLVDGSGYKIVFKFNMLDGSQYIIENFVSHDRESFKQGIELMKKQGMRFVDPYHLLEALCSNKDINLHIALVEKEKNHD